MGLAETQQALARLYTDARLRARFFAEPLTVGEELGLDSNEARRLAQISAQKADYFAASLVNKRIGEVAKLLPLTSQVLGQEFRKLFRQYAETHLPSGLKKHLEDAISFAEFAARSVRVRSIGPPWVCELIAYEKESLKMVEPGRRMSLRWFRYPVAELARAVREKNTAGLFDAERPTLAVWLRLSPHGRLRHRVFSSSKRK